MERRDLWERNFMNQRQEIVSALVEFERLLSSSDDGVDSQLLNHVITRIPDISKDRMSIREAVRQVAVEYRALMKTARLEERVLIDHADRAFGDHSSQTLGYMVFVARTGMHPVGTVDFVRKEAYFVLICPNPADYNVFYNPLLETLPAKEFTKEVETLLGHGGTYHSSLVLGRQPWANRADLPGITSGTIVAKATTDDPSFQAIIDHERQHFINQKLLRMFDASEGPVGDLKNSARIRVARSVKDEIISYVRDGMSGEATEASLRNDAYAGLFQSVSADDAESFRRIIATFAKKLDQFPHANAPGYRKALVVHLFDVPLEKIPHRIEMAAEYYAGKIRRVEEVGLPADCIPEKSAISSRFASDRLRLKHSLGLYLGLRKDCLDRLYVLSPKALDIAIEDLRVRRAVVERDMVALRPGGVAIPSGTVHYVDAKRTPEPTKPALERASKDALDEILTRLTAISTGERTAFVHAAQSGSEESFSEALTHGIADTIVSPLRKRDAGDVEFLLVPNAKGDDEHSVKVRVETTFPRLDDIYRTVYVIRIHGRRHQAA